MSYSGTKLTPASSGDGPYKLQDNSGAKRVDSQLSRRLHALCRFAFALWGVIRKDDVLYLMRNPTRIDEVLELLETVWRKNPDLRLGQILVNALSPPEPVPSVFHAEAHLVIAGLRKLADRIVNLQRPPASWAPAWRARYADEAEFILAALGEASASLAGRLAKKIESYRELHCGEHPKA